MKIKKILALVVTGVMIVTAFAGCTTRTTTTGGESNTTLQNGEEIITTSAENTTLPDGSTTTTTTTTTTASSTDVVSTTSSTKPVTDKNGKPVVTTKKQGGKTTTTKKQGSTTAAKKPPVGVVLKKNRKASCSSPNVSLATGEVHIQKGGDYVITTETDDWHGQIFIELPNTEKCNIRFEGSGLISNDTKNIIRIIDKSIKNDRTFLEQELTAGTDADNEIKELSDVDKAPNVDLSFPTGANWTFRTSANSYTGVIYNESKLTIKGNGKAKIESVKNANNCICSTKSISIKNVDLSMTTAQNESTQNLAKTTGSAKGIFSYSKVNVESGKITIKSNGDAIRCDEINIKGGTVNLTSSACDAVDADDSIIISGGTVNATALEKHSFKVRRVNNEEKAAEEKAAGAAVTVSAKSRVRAGKGDCFKINGGTVTAESKNITSLDPKFQSDGSGSSQGNITCKVVKVNKGSKEESKTPSIITISSLKKSSKNKCIKFLYSSSSVKKGTQYKASVPNGEYVSTRWSGNACFIEVKASTNK